MNSVVFRSSGQNLTTAGTYIEMTSRLLEPTLLALGPSPSADASNSAPVASQLPPTACIPSERGKPPAQRRALNALVGIWHLSEAIADADRDLRVLIARTAPSLLALPGVGPETAGQLLVTAGDNPDRLASDASFAHLCAAAPVPASSGRTDRHRLNCGGDRQANRALHTIVLVRMRHDPRTPTTWHDAPSKDSRRRTSSDASSASSRARSTTTCPAR